jgi:hypothetical protein
MNLPSAYRIPFQTVRSNREQFTLIVEQIHEILCIVVHLYSEVETDGALPTVLLYDIAKFAEYVPFFFLNEILSSQHTAKNIRLSENAAGDGQDQTAFKAVRHRDAAQTVSGRTTTFS